VAFLEAQRRRQLFAYNEETKAIENQLKEAQASSTVLEKKLSEASATVVRLIQEKKSLEERVRIAEKVAADRKVLVESIGKEKFGYESTMAEARASIESLTSQITRLQKALQETDASKAALAEDFENYKKEIQEANTPKLQPKFAEREDVRGRLNFRENGGLAIENYWADLLSRYGEAILPYEHQIRSQKTYREAADQFLKIQSFIDTNARAVAASRLPESTAIPRTERLKALTEAGMHFGEEKGVLERNKSWAQ
jgi:chromosome segregation ATPase